MKKNFDTKKYAELIIAMSNDFIMDKIEENHFVNELSNVNKLILKHIKPYQTNNGEAIQIFVQYGSILLERVGKSFYLNAMAKTYQIPEQKIKELLNGLDNHGGDNPLTAANYLLSLINSGYFEQYKISV